MKRHPLILCEGKGDAAVFNALCTHLGLTNCEILDYKGKNKLRNFLTDFAATASYTQKQYSRILVTRDNDNDPSAAWQSLKDAVQSAWQTELRGPAEYQKNPLGTPVAGYCIPNASDPGMIETLCLNSLTSQDPKLKCVNEFVNCVETHHDEPLHEKLRFGAWLISQSRGTRFELSKAVKEAHFDFTHPCFSDLSKVLKQLVD